MNPASGSAPGAGGGELAFIRRARTIISPDPRVKTGPGDDTAVLRAIPPGDILFKISSIAEGTHFAGADPELVGRRAVNGVASDFAAMGGSPDVCLISFCLPHGFAPDLPEALLRGALEACRKINAAIAGGDTISAQEGIVVTVAALGRTFSGDAIRRSGARAGDRILVTGALGGSRRSRHLRFEPRLPESRRILEIARPSAMMDVSDGLLLDLHRLVTESGAGAVLDAGAIPIAEDARHVAAETGLPPLHHALGDGEDFELLFTLGEASACRLRDAWDLSTPLSDIGQIIPSPGLFLEDRDGCRPVKPAGFQHR